MSVPALRLLHFLLMFFFIAFAIHHVYSAVLFDVEEHNGELSSIITGYKADVHARTSTPARRRRAVESEDMSGTAAEHGRDRPRERGAVRRRRRRARRAAVARAPRSGVTA